MIEEICTEIAIVSATATLVVITLFIVVGVLRATWSIWEDFDSW